MTLLTDARTEQATSQRTLRTAKRVIGCASLADWPYPFFSVEDLAACLRLSRPTLRKMIEAGVVPAVRVGTGSARQHWRIPRHAAVRAFGG